MLPVMVQLETHRLIPNEPFATYGAYLEATGESALEIARAKAPDAVVRTVQHAHLRGRGGAGFPAGTKWATLAGHPCQKRFVVCNAAEGEPGTFKDRHLIRYNPYSLLEGVLIAAHAIQSDAIYIALKASFTREIHRLEQAIGELDARDLLDGKRLEIYAGPEEYLFGEEKALLNAIEGEGPLPREAHQPPYEVGLFSGPNAPNPALVNNAETYAHVPSILRHGSFSFAELGTRDTPGTLLFTVSGDVRRPGVYEREAGLTLSELLYDVAGGPREGRELKAVISGVSSGVITPDRFDVPLDFGSLQMIGSGLGSCGFVVYDDSRSMPHLAQALLRFLYVESCNQCSACKQGLRIASKALDEIAGGGDGPGLRERALLGAERAPQGNRCYLPVQGSVVLPSLMSRFAAEFERPDPDALRVNVPKIVDFDEEKGVFVFDEAQQHKNPDWSFSAPALEDRQTSRPAKVAGGAVAVSLEREVRSELEARARHSGEELEHLVNRALREWLDSSG